MALQRRLLSLCLALLVASSSAEEKTDDKTTEAVVKAVVQAESAPRPATKDSKDRVTVKVDKEADAVAKATEEVLDSETPAESFVPANVMDKAKENAKNTFKDLKDDGVETKAAADAAAKVAVETVDGASNLALSDGSKVNAEKAAIAAGKAVADHPDNQGKALAEGVNTVKKEEKTPGKALRKDKPKGIVEKAKSVVSDLPKLAEDEADHAVSQANSMGGTSLIFLAAALGLAATAFMKYEAISKNTPYLKNLRAIRAEFDENGAPADYGRQDIEAEYNNFNELNEMTSR